MEEGQVCLLAWAAFERPTLFESIFVPTFSSTTHADNFEGVKRFEFEHRPTDSAPAQSSQGISVKQNAN